MDEAKRAAIYRRISQDRAGDRRGVTNQDEVADDFATSRGWEVARKFCDNDISASNGKLRPDYQAMMAAASRREFDVIIVFHTSRLWRNRKERAEGIEILRNAAVSVVAVKGPSLDMSTAYGRGMAGLLGEFDTMETEIKAERQQLAAVKRAENGRPPLGVRLTGYTSAGQVIEREAAVVRSMFERFHAGDSLRGIVAWLDESGVATRRGRPWSPSSVRTILINPRYAGRAIYNGKPNGHEGTWEPLVEPWLYDVVADRLADPRRRCQVGTDRKYLGSGLYECKICDQPVVSQTHSPAGKPTVIRYRCAGHIVRSGASIDRYVLEILRERLARPDLADLLTEPGNEQAAQATADIKRLRGRLKRIEADYDAELIDGARYKIATDKARTLLAAAEAAQARLMAGSEVAGTLRAPDPVAAFNASALGIQRAVLAFFMTVKLAPAPRGRHFDEDTVIICPGRQTGLL
jgi:DNA invertase Pin-like site-specific DNA recombinase